jgi:hypothetical protein
LSSMTRIRRLIMLLALIAHACPTLDRQVEGEGSTLSLARAGGPERATYHLRG